MKLVDWRIAVVWVLAAALGGMLLYTSQNVQDAGDELRGLERSITAEQQALEILNAEWEYLNAPQRLEKLAQEYFGMNVPGGDNLLAQDADLPFPSPIQNMPDDLLQPVSDRQSAEGSL